MSKEPSDVKKKTGSNDDPLGYCYMNKSCTGAKVVDVPISYEECQEVGGSWEGPDGNCYRT